VFDGAERAAVSAARLEPLVLRGEMEISPASVDISGSARGWCSMPGPYPMELRREAVALLKRSGKPVRGRAQQRGV
jgi:hypothetical protein